MAMKKTPYAPPVLIPLGELARGSGICDMGSLPSNNPNQCTAGPGAKFVYPPNCATGHGATDICNNGGAVGKKP
jgi:hypothetical protein